MTTVITAGYRDVQGGHIATAVTSLEMRARPATAAIGDIKDLTLTRRAHPDSDWYRQLFRAVGEEWLWFSRLCLPENELRAILDDGRVEIHALAREGREIGLLELDFREPDRCDLAFFGVTRDAIGTGAGRFMMGHALARAWSKPIRRVCVHTCSLDHPRALGFYVRSGFLPIKRQVEVFPDPRLMGVLPRSAAPHVPVIEG